MNKNRRNGVEWAAHALLAKPGVTDLRAADVEHTFWGALDWGNYRLLTEQVGLSPNEYERWILAYYTRMFALDRGLRRRRPSTCLPSPDTHSLPGSLGILPSQECLRAVA
jgi:hypothetical protein